MKNNRELFKKRKHGFDIPEWVWNMITEGKIRSGLPSNAAWIIQAIKEKAERDGFLNNYQNILNKKSEVSQLSMEGENGIDG